MIIFAKFIIDPILPGIAFGILFRIGTNRMRYIKSGILAYPYYCLWCIGGLYALEFWRRQVLENVLNEQEYAETLAIKYVRNVQRTGYELEDPVLRKFLVKDSVNE